MFGQEHDLPDVDCVVPEVAVKESQEHVLLSPENDRSAEVVGFESVEGFEEDVPGSFSSFERDFLCVSFFDDELQVPVAGGPLVLR